MILYIFVFLCLTYFTRHSTLQVHLCYCKLQISFFLAKQYSSVCVCVCVCVCDIFIHSWIRMVAYVSIHGYLLKQLWLLHILAVTNSTSVNIGVNISLWVKVFIFRYIPRSGIAGYVSSIFSFLRNLHATFHSDAPIYIPTNSVQGFPFLHIVPDIRW